MPKNEETSSEDSDSVSDAEDSETEEEHDDAPSRAPSISDSAFESDSDSEETRPKKRRIKTRSDEEETEAASSSSAPSSPFCHPNKATPNSPSSSQSRRAQTEGVESPVTLPSRAASPVRSVSNSPQVEPAEREPSTVLGKRVAVLSSSGLAGFKRCKNGEVLEEIMMANIDFDALPDDVAKFLQWAVDWGNQMRTQHEACKKLSADELRRQQEESVDAAALKQCLLGLGWTAPGTTGAAGGPSDLAPVAPADRWVGSELSTAIRDKTLPEALRRELERDYQLVIRHDTRDKKGREFVPGESGGSFLGGGFPHAVLCAKTGKDRNKNVYWVAPTHEVNLRIKLKRDEKSPLPPSGAGRSQEVLDKLKPFIETQNGRYETSLFFYVELQFADGSDVKVSADSKDADFSFIKELPNNALFSPGETRPFTGGKYELKMINGTANVRFRFNNNVTSSNLTAKNKDRKFRLVVKCMNPYLKTLRSFSAKSAAFGIKATLANDVKKGEHYVNDPSSEKPVLCTPKNIPYVMVPTKR